MIRKLLFCFCLFLAPVSSFAEALPVHTNLSSVKEGFVQTKDAKLFYRTLGRGQPLIVVHGGPGLTQDYLLPQMYKLAESNFVVFYDQRGCGRSTGDINSETMTTETFINDIEAIRQAFNFDKISILGHSWGGFLAMQYAISHPEHVHTMILSNAMPASSEELALFIQEYMKRTAPYQEKLDHIRNSQAFKKGDPQIVEHYYRIIFRTYCYSPEHADLLNLYMTPTASINGSQVAENIRKNVFEKSFNLHDSLKTLKIPTLILHGDADPIPSSTMQNLHKSISHSSYILMKNCGHFPYVENPDMYFKYIKEFLHRNPR